MRVGDRVLFRGKHADRFSVRGVVELVIPKPDGSAGCVGVRLENGNYKAADPSQVKPEETA